MASGSGTNAENLIRYAIETNVCEIACVITDKKNAGVIQKAESLNIECLVIPIIKKNLNEPFSSAKKSQETQLLDVLKSRNVEWVFLAGYMRILSSDFINEFWDEDLQKTRIINIHPSLLPLFPGANAYEQAWDAGVTESGATVHHVDSGIDTGPIIMQDSFKRLEKDDFESFKTKGMQIEYELYKKAVAKLLLAENSNEQI